MDSVYVVAVHGREEMPASWRDAIWTYARTWPHSAASLAPFLRISETQRIAFVRGLLQKAATADDIGVLGIAADIGAYAQGWPVVGGEL